MKEVLTHRASRAQQQLWFIEQLVPGEPVHNISFDRRYAGVLDPAVLRAAVADVVGRHESLRTRFEERDQTLWQVVLTPPDEPPVEFADLTGAADPEAAYRELSARTGTRVFDLAEAPLLRIVHARLDGGTDTGADALVVVLHHMVADAISAEILMRELTVAYEKRLAGEAPDWPELPVQYADFTAWQEERSADPAVLADLSYWRGQLAELSTLDLTHGRPRPATPSQRGQRLEFTIEPATAAALDEFVRTERATAFMGLLAAYAATLGRVFGGEDVAVASTVSGRPLPELRELIGMFIDQIVLRLDLSAGPTFRELVRAARQVVSEAHDHGSVTFDQIVAAVAPERAAGMSPLAQAAINLQPAAAARPPAGRMPKATTGSLIDTGMVAHDLWLDVLQDPVPYTGTVRYRPEVIDDATAGLVCEVFPRLLAAVLAEPDRPIGTFDGLWPAAAAPAEPADVLVHKLVSYRASVAPGAPAVGWAGGALDYAGLDAAANRVAHALRDRGAGPEVPVVVALPRSAEQVVAFLGVLKAGAVCVPAAPSSAAAVAGECGARLALADGGSPIETVLVDLAPAPDPGPVTVTIEPDNGACLLDGVLLTHRNVVSAVDGLHAVLPAGSAHRLAADASVTTILAVLAGGGTLHLADTGPVDFVHATSAQLADLPDGKHTVVLEEPVAEDGRDLVVLYGPAGAGFVAAGRPGRAEVLPGVRVDVLNRWGGRVPPGCLGELWIAGPRVPRGMPAAPGETAAAFGPDPLVPGARRYRTGEVVRMRRDGRLEFRPRPAPSTEDVVAAPGPADDLDATPATATERLLLEGWQWLLPGREFGVTDDFFDIGGDSILAIHAVSEARRHGFEMTVRQIIDLRTIRGLAGAFDAVEAARRPAPLGLAGPTVLRLPGPAADVPEVPGVTVDGAVLTADPSQVDDWSLARLVRELRPATPDGRDGDAPGVPVPPETMRALAGPAHEAYATTTTDLVVAATLAATGAPAVAVADTRRAEPSATGPAEPGLVRVGPAAGETELIQSVKAALHAPDEDDPAVPGVRVLPLPDGVTVTATGDAGSRTLVTLAGAWLIVTGDGAAWLGERVRDHLVRLVAHCAAAEPVYSAADFPDAGLDDDAVAGLLAGFEDLDSEAAP